MLLLRFAAGAGQVFAVQEQTPVAFKAIRLPNVDGRYDTSLIKAVDSAGNTITVDEWNDTRRQGLHSFFSNDTMGGKAVAEFSMKFDENYLYVLMDYMTNANPGYDPGKKGELIIDSFSIAFDTMRNGGQLPQPDDYVFVMTIRPASNGGWGYSWYARQGTGNGWSQMISDPSSPVYFGFQARPGIGRTNNNVTKSPHIFAEFRFSRTFLGSEGVRVRIFGYDLETDMIVRWPKEAISTMVIDLYGDIVFLAQVIPEFSSFLVAPTSLVVAFGLLRTYRRKRRLKSCCALSDP